MSFPGAKPILQIKHSVRQHQDRSKSIHIRNGNDSSDHGPWGGAKLPFSWALLADTRLIGTEIFTFPPSYLGDTAQSQKPPFQVVSHTLPLLMSWQGVGWCPGVMAKAMINSSVFLNQQACQFHRQYQGPTEHNAEAVSPQKQTEL